MNAVYKPQKSELVAVLISAIEAFPAYDGTLNLSLSNGVVTSFTRSLCGHADPGEGQTPYYQYSKINKNEVIQRLDTSISNIAAGGEFNPNIL